MPAGYAQVTLTQLIAQISALLDDNGATPNSFYTVPELTYAIQEALYVFGALTSFWRQRSSFNAKPTDLSPFYDLSQLVPQYRPRTITLNAICQELQFHLLENPSGIAGTGMSGQVSITTILNAIQRARNRFILDVHFPNTVHPNFTSSPPPDGLVSFPQTSVFVHRASWQDSGGQWANLWRQDEWAFDKASYQWTTEPGFPSAYSEASLAPLELQIYPPPLNAGNLEAITVDSVTMDLTNPNTLIQVPDEWAWAVKFAALEDILTAGGQITDDLRAQYCAQRYKQAVTFARDARSILRLTMNGLPLAIDSMAALDAGYSYWRNQPGQTPCAGVMYDLVCVPPVTAPASIGVDIVQSAPVPVNPGDFIPIGEENLEDIVSYVVNYVMLKCGGNEFKATMPMFDDFLRAVSVRKGVNAAKISYFTPLFGTWQKEEAERPDQKLMYRKLSLQNIQL